VVAIGLQDEIDLLQHKVANLETLLQNGDLPRSSVAIRNLFKSLSVYAYSRVQRENFNYLNCTNKNGFKPDHKAGD
jgi:hypothetical protein